MPDEHGTLLEIVRNGQEQNSQARPALVAQKSPTGEWKIAVFHNTLIANDAVPALAEALAKPVVTSQ